jgi:NTE family protein
LLETAHIMASGALPPAFPAVTVDGESYWGRWHQFEHAHRGRPRRRAAPQLAHLLTNRLPMELRADPTVQDLADYGCGTLMHLVRLLSPRLDGKDHTKDIDFTRSGIERRWKAGHDHARKVLAEKPWQGAVDTLAGVVIHEASE